MLDTIYKHLFDRTYMSGIEREQTRVKATGEVFTPTVLVEEILALSTIYGVDLMPDNVELCRERLLCGREDLKHIVELNIVCADALTYHYRFDGTDASVTNKDLHLRELGFEFS